MSNRSLFSLIVAGLAAVAAYAQPQAPQGPQVKSPEILADGKVAFRIVAPAAESVGMMMNDVPAYVRDGPQLAKGENGVWEAVVGPIDPGAYRYRFIVNGVPVMDPRNPLVSESNTNTWSLFYVPGAEFMDSNKVPHGAIAEITYYSTALGRDRRMHVYTPPGYEKGAGKFPVFYLLHGGGDNDDAWSSVGRAGFILDNLIAAKKAVPMIVVMPAGHTSASFAMPGGAGANPPRDEFAEDFVTDVMPYVEANYRVIADRAHRAMAGLSMGGGQTLNVGMSHLNQFAYLGVFSSGVFGPRRPAAPGAAAPAVAPPPVEWEQQHAADLDNAALKPGLKLLWFATGADDFLIQTSKASVEMLKKHGFNPVWKETTGAHTWINWRNYLNEFAPQLFR
jgi:enterochelin esterase family protein